MIGQRHTDIHTKHFIHIEDTAFAARTYTSGSLHRGAVTSIRVGTGFRRRRRRRMYGPNSWSNFCPHSHHNGRWPIIRPRRMHEWRTTAVDDPVAWASVSQSVCLFVCWCKRVSVTWATVLTLRDFDAIVRPSTLYCRPPALNFSLFCCKESFKNQRGCKMHLLYNERWRWNRK